MAGEWLAKVEAEGEKKADNLISVTFSRAAVLDQASRTAYVKAII